ncbi:MAG TPA: nucleotidyl transferase AbiEii/AbiGii toxin family protein [Terriglobia bacterium]|nr:nucleotidyl transferase AbiEii/AbiGii toxin family protein [Terriglobia bacterium]
MTQRAPTNLSASVHQLLLNKARQTRRPFNELLQYYAMERFLYRLSKSPHATRFILKGALMFTAWKLESYRPTKDIDLLGKTANQVESVVAIVRRVCAQSVAPDGLAFDPATVKGARITENANYEGVRIRFQSNLGAARVTLQLDIGFGDVIVPAPQLIEYPTLLDFEAPRLCGYSKESIVAEKFESLVILGVLNSRMKDYFDIWTLSRQFDFDGQTLGKAIAKTFSNRGTKIVPEPIGLTAKFADDSTKKSQWRGFIRKSRLDASPDLAVVIVAIASFLGPLVTALSAGKGFREKWTSPGPWKHK